ncbi:MtnX-like HAD-IB family phosphatase [Candidatus Ruminimicrobiellum ovillum]|uniref:MtnX-like HAD-IB family phosphatase n=1 Tax=Candidatus Ruminimicrobiellum ovillum TaxID=1947927 RepID=UPI003559EDE1
MKTKIVLISDFDGTISKKDFFYMVIDTLLKDKKDALAPWNDYLNGKIKHIDALTGIFSQIHLTQQELDEFISTIEVDPFFYDTAKYCMEKKIPFYICSAGTNYYIKKRIVDTLSKYNIILISNDATYSQQDGMKLVAPEETSPYYNSNTGISKEKIVQKLKDDGFFTIYAGDGKPDFKSAQIADVVFAKDMLLELCKEKNIKTKPFNDFKDILNYIRSIYEQ